MKKLSLCRTVTNAGVRYYINGKRVSLEKFQTAKFRRRQDCFVTRATRDAVRDYSAVTIED